MNDLFEKLDVIASKCKEYGYGFIEGATEADLAIFLARCKNDLGLTPPDQYLGGGKN